MQAKPPTQNLQELQQKVEFAEHVKRITSQIHAASNLDQILLDLHNNRGAMGYGMEAFDAKDPLAWPGFATEDDVRGLPPVYISVNECDPLRDEGIAFYRLLLRAGQPARARTVLGTAHGTEILPFMCPDISRDTAASIAEFARTV